MTFSRLTWTGLMVVALGWALLLSGNSATEEVLRVFGRASAPLNFTLIGQATILTGFGLAILGALQTGFGTLKQFFDTVLERTAQNARIAAEAPQQPSPSPSPSPSPKKVVERGTLRDRSYMRFGDGTIEIETLLGLRRFASIQEAREFIGN
ncbi:MAG: hypothetical protein EPN75_10450 [Beijerinckiaceae bacterium]|nr:MAG: hypothetical protein EPN75_10450 [Beijerinckiaceae bacterium]